MMARIGIFGSLCPSGALLPPFAFPAGFASPLSQPTPRQVGKAAVSALQSALSPGRSGTIGRGIPLWLLLCSRRFDPPSAASADELAMNGRPKCSTGWCDRVGRPHAQSILLLPLICCRRDRDGGRRWEEPPAWLRCCSCNSKAGRTFGVRDPSACLLSSFLYSFLNSW